jgi:redox-sensitive bicupin YhaK (pirin superfamily)
VKQVTKIFTNPQSHWVGDGFPVRSLFSYGEQGNDISPFLLLDFAGPHVFEPTAQPRGVGQHPHRGFETVTIVYEGEVAHRDSTGRGGVIRPGDVQWMTAASGILHEEFHSPDFTRNGGPFLMMQLWVNLPARDKMSKPGYQAILAAEIPKVDLPANAGSVRVIAGEFAGARGPAHTFTPVNVWDLRLNAGASTKLTLPPGHTALLVVQTGKLVVGADRTALPAEVVQLSRNGSEVALRAEADTMIMVLTGEPINEPIAGYGPFVMNSRAEISQAITDFNSGHFGTMPAP